MDRNTIHRPQVRPQSADDMPQILQRAASENKEVAVNDAGLLHPIEDSTTRWRSSFLKLFGQEAEPAEVLYRRMIEEAASKLALGVENAAMWVEGHMGSLPKLKAAIDKGHIEPVKKDWAVANDIFDKSRDLPIYAKREEVLSKMRTHLPRALGLNPDDGAIAEINQPLGLDSAARILESLRSMEKEPVNVKTNLAAQFETDAHRGMFAMKNVDGSEQRFDGSSLAAVSAGLREFAGNDETLALTLSKMTNQGALAQLAAEVRYALEAPNKLEPNFGAMKSFDHRHRTQLMYCLERNAAGEMLFTASYYQVGHSLLLDNGELIPINRWPGSDLPAGRDNYAGFYELTATFSEADLRSGRIEPRFDTQPKAGYRIMVDWAGLNLDLSSP